MVCAGFTGASPASNGLRNNACFMFPPPANHQLPRGTIASRSRQRHLRSFRGCGLSRSVRGHRLPIPPSAVAGFTVSLRAIAVPYSRRCRSRGQSMKIDDVRRTAYSMPLTNPAFPMGPYRFFNREFFVITYRTDPRRCRRRAGTAARWPIPSSTTNSSACPIPPASATTPKPGRSFRCASRARTALCAFDVSRRRNADRGRPRALGLPKKLARPKLAIESDAPVGTLHYGSVLCASPPWATSIAPPTMTPCSRA